MPKAERHHPRSAPPVSADAVVPREARLPVPLEPRHLYHAVWLLLGVLVLYRFFDVITRFLLVVYAAVILAVGLDALGRRLPLQRRWLAVMIGLTGVAGVALLLGFGVPVLLRQTRDLVEMGPGLMRQLESWEAWIFEQTGMRLRLARLRSGGGLPFSGARLLGNAATVLEMLLLPLVVFFGALFALASPNERLLNPLLRAVRRDLRPAVYRIFQLLGERLLGWLKGAVLAMVVVGTLSCALFWMIGVPNALLLGLLNGLVEFVPLLGPWIGGSIAVLVALVDDPAKAPWVALAALAIQQVEGNIVTPLAMSREAKIHPFITLFALVLCGWMFGLLGMLLALPIVLLVWTLAQVLWVERAIDTDRDAISPVVQE
jgi:predicted PurR-regulated permease PerM